MWEIKLSKKEVSHPMDGPWLMIMTTESNSLAQISAYMAENRLNSDLVKNYKKNWDGLFGLTKDSESRRFNCIYDNEPLRFEEDLLYSTKNM